MHHIPTGLKLDSPRAAIAITFLLRGIVQGSWYPRIPGIAAKLEITTGQLGAIWFLVALGSIVSFSIAAALIRRVGSARSGLIFAIPFPLILVVASLAPNLPIFVLCMIVFGIGTGGYDISTSVQGGIVERATNAPLVSALYGFFSLGALVGSLTSGLIAQQGVSITLHFLALAIVTIPISLVATRHLLPEEHRPTQANSRRRRLSLPPGIVWPLGLTIVCIAIGEETVNNWAALYIRQDLGGTPAIGSLAYTAFSVATFIGRMTGDQLIVHLGVERVLMGGSVLAAFGMAGGVLVNTPISVIVGYTLVGIGLSVVVPVTYRRASSLPSLSPGDAVAGTATIGYLGFLLGPLLVGALADAVSLRLAIMVVSVIVLGIFALTAIFPPRRTVSADPIPRQ